MKRPSRRNPSRLFKERDEFVKTHPDFIQSYNQFLEDLGKYKELEKPQEKRQGLNDYLIFGASFQEE